MSCHMQLWYHLTIRPCYCNAHSEDMSPYTTASGQKYASTLLRFCIAIYAVLQARQQACYFAFLAQLPHWCRSAECFVQLLNLLNIDYPPEAGTQLCEKVLATLMVLLAGNEASRKQLQQGVGYDSLQNIVLKCTAPHGPSGGILMQLLHLVLEVRLRGNT